MRVLSPVGTFPLRVAGVRMEHRTPIVEAEMGVWRSEVRLEPQDLPLILGAGAVIAGAFLVGRVTSGHNHSRR